MLEYRRCLIPTAWSFPLREQNLYSAVIYLKLIKVSDIYYTNKLKMKYIYLTFLVFIFCLTACKKNTEVIKTNEEILPPDEIPTIDLEWSATIGEQNSVWNWSQDIGKLHNVLIQLIYDGIVLDETNTNGKGEFSFPNQPVPEEGAYFQFKSEGYYNTVIKADDSVNDITRLMMLPNTFPNINGEAISDGGPYITLKGKLQEPTGARFIWLYLTNANDELVGTALPKGDGTSFTITTLPDKDLFLHYNTECYPEGIISLGSFSEDTDLGTLLDQSFDLSITSRNVELQNVYDCTGNEISDYHLFYKRDGLTHPGATNSNIHPECRWLAAPVIATVVTQDPRKYQEKTINFSTGSTPTFDMTVCEDDDTFIHYTLGNGSGEMANSFTTANILGDGRLVMRQRGFDNDRRFTFIFPESTVGSHTCKVISYSSGLEIDLGGNQLNATITLNDGEFVEGDFSGEVWDADEASLGILEGNFRARIQ